MDENNEIDDMTLYALGLKSKTDIDKIINAVKYNTELNDTGKVCNVPYYEDIDEE